MSSRVVSWPSETRRTPRACSSLRPIAMTMSEGRVTPAWQAEPADTAMPAMSKAMRTASGRAVGRERWMIALDEVDSPTVALTPSGRWERR